MPTQPAALEFRTFGVDDYLTSSRGSTQQIDYLLQYLRDVGAKSTIEEPQYFDKDFLSEFAAFYATSSFGYSNTCRRVHFFSQQIDAGTFERSLAGDTQNVAVLSENYLGFLVARPLLNKPVGRTVLSLYPESDPGFPRVTTPAREYSVCVAGLSLVVEGLAWQQQDAAVGACATIALWSLLHASGLDGLHQVPTTAEVTLSANKSPSLGRVFPSSGLDRRQLCEVIRAHKLSPLYVPGSLICGRSAFDRERFCASACALIRSGFPVMICGNVEVLQDGKWTPLGGHAVCAVGFRSADPGNADQGSTLHYDRNVPNLYVHDDNIGPNARFSIDCHDDSVVLYHSPPSTPADSHASYRLIPDSLIAAVPDELRTSVDALHRSGLANVLRLSRLIGEVAGKCDATVPGLVITSKFVRLRDYLSEELRSVLSGSRLAGVRLALVNEVPPMSLYLGVTRIGVNETPVIDVLWDTTDSEAHYRAFAYVVYDSSFVPFIEALQLEFGVCVLA